MTDRFRVVILPQASADLADIFAYVEQDSPQNAVGVAERLIAGIDSLEAMPRRFKRHRSNRDPNRVIHSLSVRPYIAYYRVSEAKRSVEILTIRHGARRQPRRFP